MKYRLIRKSLALLLCTVIIFSVYTAEAKKFTGPLIVSQPEAVAPFISGDETAEAPIFSVGLNQAGSAAFSCTWTVDGVEAGTGDTFRMDSFADTDIGVHTVQCHVTYRASGSDDLEEDSLPVSWIHCAGVLPNSALTFSDVHKDYTHIGLAIDQVMKENDGLIPALIICTGDWTSGYHLGEETALEKVFPNLYTQCGGIDTVYTAGNHDNSQAARTVNAMVGLGADEIGASFVSRPGRSGTSAYAENLAVFPIHFEDVIVRGGKKIKTYSYQNVLDRLETFLRAQAESGTNPMIVISSHTGLHTLGIQPESTATKWVGKSMYNVGMSNRMVQLLNKYAEEFGLRIVYFFGHDHSQREKEFQLRPEERIHSTIRYTGKKWTTLKLKFFYAHAGYLTSHIRGTKHFSLLVWNDSSYTVTLDQLE